MVTRTRRAADDRPTEAAREARCKPVSVLGCVGMLWLAAQAVNGYIDDYARLERQCRGLGKALMAKALSC